MTLKINLLVGAALALGCLAPLHAEAPAAPLRLGAEKPVLSYLQIEIRNLQDEPLGRITDLGIDLVNGRIVEVLVICDKSLDVAGKIVAVPPLLLKRDAASDIYRLDMSPAIFKQAPAIDFKRWVDAGRSERVASFYHFFGQDAYFQEEGAAPAKAEDEAHVALGYIERSSKILDLPVANPQGDEFGTVFSMTMDILRGRILNVIILAPGNFQTKSIVPAMALSFNPARKGLILDDSKTEFADEPRYVLTEAAYGQKAYSKEEAYKGPHTTVALEQGSGYRDISRTVRIHRKMRLARINGRHIEVGTNNGRVTLRGWVYTADDKLRIGQIAIAASRLELVDNQITVGRPEAVN